MKQIGTFSNPVFHVESIKILHDPDLNPYLEYGSESRSREINISTMAPFGIKLGNCFFFKQLCKINLF